MLEHGDEKGLGGSVNPDKSHTVAGEAPNEFLKNVAGSNHNHACASSFSG